MLDVYMLAFGPIINLACTIAIVICTWKFFGRKRQLRELREMVSLIREETKNG